MLEARLIALRQECWRPMAVLDMILDDTSVSKERLLCGRVQCTRYRNMQSHTRECMLPENCFLLKDKGWGRSIQRILTFGKCLSHLKILRIANFPIDSSFELTATRIL